VSHRACYWFVLSRPEHAEHVLAANQDNYVKAFTYRPLRALVGNGRLTSEGEMWRRHLRLIQPVFSRREATGFGTQMTGPARRLAARRLTRAMIDLTADIAAAEPELAAGQWSHLSTGPPCR
jgi:cytochrome P450